MECPGVQSGIGDLAAAKKGDNQKMAQAAMSGTEVEGLGQYSPAQLLARLQVHPNG